MEGTSSTNPGVVAKKGNASPVSMSINDFNKPNENAGSGEGSDGNGGSATGASGGTGGGAAAGGSGTGDGGQATLTDDQLIAGLKALGVEITGGINEVKEKLTKSVQQAELTEEQKKQAAEQKDIKLLQLYMTGGGTPEQFVSMKNLLTANPDEISVAQIKKELKDANFSDEDISAIMAERYYQIELDKLERTTDESEEDFQKRKDSVAKKAAFGKSKITARGTQIINQAKSFFTGLEEAMSIQESLAGKEADFSSKVDEMVSALDKKVVIQLGKINDKEIAPIELEITAEDIAEVTGILKDKVKREQYFNNKDTGLNLENVLNLMLRNRYLENAVKLGWLNGRDNSVTEFRKVFPGASAQNIGLGADSSSLSSSGKAAKAGRPSPMPVTLK